MKSLSITVALGICFVLVGCKKTHEDVMKGSLSCVKEMTDVMKTVKDEASAKAAAPKIKAIADRMKALGEEAKKMSEPSKEEAQRLKEKYEPQMKEAMSAFMGEVMRITMDSKLSAAKDAFGEASKTMQSIK